MRISIHKFSLFVHDALLIEFSILLTNYLFITYHPAQGTFLGYIGAGISLGFIFLCLFEFSINKMYSYQIILNPYKQMIALIMSLGYTIFFFIMISFVFKIHSYFFQRSYLAYLCITMIVFFWISRAMIIPRIYYWIIGNHKIHKNLLIIGAGEYSKEISGFLQKNKKSYFNIVGFLDDDEKKQNLTVNGVKVLGTINQISSIIGQYKISELLISINNIEDNRLHEIIELCKTTKKNIYVISKYYKKISEKLEVEEFSDISAFRITPSFKPVYDYIAHIYGIFVAFVIILATFPFWLIIALLIKLDSKGPVFYKPIVIGCRGKQFKMFKFRSMYTNTATTVHKDYTRKVIQENGNTFKLQNDPRITKVGRLLRKYSIDEFPQLLNVLKGDMNLVGPRPCLPYEYEVMDEWHKRRFGIKPGMTGIWQITGRNEVRFSEQIALDIYYVEHRSLQLDLEILLKTVPVVFLGKGGL
jgi:exopolysaccharide biosynthesis polyprenyl glycosylphosphotransferase